MLNIGLRRKNSRAFTRTLSILSPFQAGSVKGETRFKFINAEGGDLSVEKAAEDIDS